MDSERIEPPTVEVGTWWRSPSNVAWVVQRLQGEGGTDRPGGEDAVAYLRSPDLGWSDTVGTEVMARSYTRLPGPPEPKPGDVYVIDGDTVGHRDMDGEHSICGVGGWESWEWIVDRYSAQMASLWIMGNVGGRP